MVKQINDYVITFYSKDRENIDDDPNRYSVRWPRIEPGKYRGEVSIRSTSIPLAEELCGLYFATGSLINCKSNANNDSCTHAVTFDREHTGNGVVLFQDPEGSLDVRIYDMTDESVDAVYSDIGEHHFTIHLTKIGSPDTIN
jgi:hypothetical protein